jgi:hypothetical protein
MGRRLHHWVWGVLVVSAACEPTQGQVFQHLATEEVAAPDPLSSGAGGGAAAPSTPAPAEPTTASDTEPPVTPEPGLDPNLHFEWQQSLPGQGTCKAGLYVGSFECTVPGPLGPVRIEGQMTFTLVGSDEAQVLEVRDGMLSDFTGEWFAAVLEGSLTCVDKRVSVRTVDGRAKPMPAGLPPEWWAILPELGTFEALFGASYDDQLLFMEGGMAMFNSLGESCTGTWRAGFVP